MPASTEAWASTWFWWLFFVAATFAILEIASILTARRRGQKIAEVWTLSETIRRWSVGRRWLAPVAVGIIAMLIWHWFAQLNPS